MNSTKKEDERQEQTCSFATKKLYLQECLNLENEDLCKEKHNVGYCSMIEKEEMSTNDNCGYVYEFHCEYDRNQTVEKCLCEKEPSLNLNLNKLSTMSCLCINMDDESDEPKEKVSSCKTKRICQKMCVPQTSENTKDRIYKCMLNYVKNDSTSKESHSASKLTRRRRQSNGTLESANKTHIKNTTTTTTTTTTNATASTIATSTFSRNQNNQSTICPSEKNNLTTSAITPKIILSSENNSTKAKSDLNNTSINLNDSINQYASSNNFKNDFHLQIERHNITSHKTTDPLKITMPILIPLMILFLALYYYYRQKKRRSNRVYIKRKLLSHKIKTIKVNNRRSSKYESGKSLHGANRFSGYHDYVSLKKHNELLNNEEMEIKPSLIISSFEKMKKKKKEDEDKVIEE